MPLQTSRKHRTDGHPRFGCLEREITPIGINGPRQDVRFTRRFYGHAIIMKLAAALVNTEYTFKGHQCRVYGKMVEGGD